jgi:hypothetical protein
MLVVSRLAIDAVLEDGNHVLLSQLVEVVSLVPAVEHVGHHVRRRRIDNGGGNDVWHISSIFVLGKTQTRL